MIRLPSSLRDGRYVPRTPWRGLAALGMTVAIFVAAQLATFAVFRLAGFDMLRAGGVSLGREAANGPLLVWMLVSQGFMVLLAVLAAGAREALPQRVLQLNPVSVGTIAAGIAGLLVVVGAVNLVTWLIDPAAYLGDVKPFVPVLRSRWWLVAALVIVAGAPLSEELLFRGFLLSALARSRLGFLGGALITNALWTSLHIGYSALGLFEVFTAGLYLSWLLWRTGSLLPSLACHAVANGLFLAVVPWLPTPG